MTQQSSASFLIDGREFQADLSAAMTGSIPIQSVPRPYSIEFADDQVDLPATFRSLLRASHNIVIIDRKVAELHFSDASVFEGMQVRLVDALETHKNVGEALHLVEFLAAQKVTKASEIFAIGGGIVQDLTAFTCAVFKRGVPWTFLPTTVLAQGDSGVGGKSALNHDGAKNIIALFSAPRRVVIHPSFWPTLPQEDLLSGLGEVFRLHLTGGAEVWRHFDSDCEAFAGGDAARLTTLIRRALAVKKAVVEVDEFELNHRRSMNYGHSIGHALEGCVDYRIPHGTAVALGCMVENQLAVYEGYLPQSVADEVLGVGKKIVLPRCVSEFAAFEAEGLFQFLAQDKKAQGATLFFALIRSIGDMGFFGIDLANESKRSTIVRAVEAVRAKLQ